MPLTTGTPPKTCDRIASEAVRGLTDEATEGPVPDIALPHEVYAMGLDDVVGGDLKKARRTGWRYLVLQGDRAVAAAVVDAPEGKARMQFSHVNSGPFVEETVNAVAQAEGLEAVARGDYEVRLLNIPALYVMALWLHGERDDLLLPMPPTNESLDAKKVYAAADLLKRLKRPAQARSAFDDTPRPGAKAGRPA